ncbi:MAG TPA: hypothetical protein VF773_08165 [Verrucomicrobiae bacterium]
MPQRLKIKFRKKRNSDSEYLVINGTVDRKSRVYTYKAEKRTLYIYSNKTWDQLTSVQISDLSEHFHSLHRPYDAGWEGWDRLDISFQSDRESKPSIVFQLQPDTDVWARPYTLVEYCDSFQAVIKREKSRGIAYEQPDELLSNGFGIRCRIRSMNSVASEEIARCEGCLQSIRDKVEETLLEKSRNTAITRFFSFPPEIKTSCEQYLLYFIQFLEDLGIKAKAELREDARKVLFSITPSDGPGALESIRQALEIYLRLPGMPNFGNVAGHYPNVAVRQLHANILHLESQLLLAKASSDAKDAVIEALQLTNYQYKQAISSQEKPADKQEALVGDTIHVTKLEGKGFVVDLPLILKRLKRVLGVGIAPPPATETKKIADEGPKE